MSFRRATEIRSQGCIKVRECGEIVAFEEHHLVMF